MTPHGSLPHGGWSDSKNLSRSKGWLPSSSTSTAISALVTAIIAAQVGVLGTCPRLPPVLNRWPVPAVHALPPGGIVRVTVDSGVQERADPSGQRTHSLDDQHIRRRQVTGGTPPAAVPVPDRVGRCAVGPVPHQSHCRCGDPVPQAVPAGVQVFHRQHTAPLVSRQCGRQQRGKTGLTRPAAAVDADDVGVHRAIVPGRVRPGPPGRITMRRWCCHRPSGIWS